MRPRLFFSRDDLPRGIETIDLLDPTKDISGIWVYFPWRTVAVHIPGEDLYYQLRTNRNKNLITKEEQEKFRSCKIGIAGLSVGSAILETLVLSGGPKIIKLADPDIVDMTNLNRMKASLLNVGENKAVVAARRAWELDPFLRIQIWKEGLKAENLNDFIAKDPKLDIFIDEMDNIEMKINSRFVCRHHGIPVIMATDLGDRVMLDIERFDIEPSRPLFHGLVDIDHSKLKGLAKDGALKEKWLELAGQVIGSANLPERLSESFKQVGKTLDGVPQLGSTAALAGAVATYAIRQIACRHEMSSGRYFVDLEKLIG